MDIRIIAVGKIKEKYLQRGIEHYRKCLSHYCNIEIIEVADEKAPETLSPTEEIIVKEKEGDRIAKAIRERSFVIALAIEGKSLTSEQFAKQLQKLTISGRENVDFIIGGSLGLDSKIIKQADMLLSFSKFTFPHQLMRLILLEQIYRTQQI